ncbi:MAG: O-antigen ligase family protein [Elusimicrobia bacterium]|nr:O-antigen ligase family protein [Elusimicrobiota bacterium]
MLAAWRSEPALGALVLYGAAGLLAALLSAWPAAAARDALKDWHRLWSLGLFAAALAVEPEAPVLPALAASFGLMALIGSAQPLSAGWGAWGNHRAHGFVHPVVYGEQMALAVLGGLSFLIRPDRRWPRAAAGLLVVLAAAALYLSQTRMALFAAALGFGALLLREARARRWLFPALLLTAAAAVSWQYLPTEGRTLTAVFERYSPNNPQQARFALWDAAWKMFEKHPLTGVGPSGYRRDFERYHPAPVGGQADWGSAHDLYLHQLAERGLLGEAALLLLLCVLLLRAWRAARDGGAAALWAAAAIPAFLAMNLTETAFQNEQFAALLLLIWACGTAPLRRGGEII